MLACLCFAALAYRLVEIQVLRHEELSRKARRYTEARRAIEAWRGQILDCNRTVLAISVPIKRVYIAPAFCAKHVEEAARACGSWLGIAPEALARRLRACLQRLGHSGPPKALLLKSRVSMSEWERIAQSLERETFGLCKPKMTAAEKAELSAMRRRLLFARDGQERVYPFGECLSHTVGFASAGSHGCGLLGRCGEERAFNAVLAGEDGLLVSEQDAAGNELPLRRTVEKPPRDGDNVVLTIDLRVQHILEEALAAALAQTEARGASALILRAATFEVLGAASLPNYDPQHPGVAPGESWRNPLFSDMVEPGSTLKLIALAAALDTRTRTLESTINCEQGCFIVNKVVVHDHARYGWLSLRQCFAKSSNVGFAKVALELGPERFYCYLTNFGFGRRTGVACIGEAPGRIEPPGTWTTMMLTRAAFGQGLSASPLQMAVAYGVIANGGRLMRPLLVSRIESPQGRVLQRFPPQFIRQVISPQTARDATDALKTAVLPGGTGEQAALDGYTMAVKTGTAQKSDQHGYLPGCYYSSMIGFFPADSPQVVIFVALDQPRNGYYAGSVVGPVFRSIAQQVAACLAIPPDKPALARTGGSTKWTVSQTR